MPTVEIQGVGEFEVDDSFLSLNEDERLRQIDALVSGARPEPTIPQPGPLPPPATEQQADAATGGDELRKRSEFLPVSPTVGGGVALSVPGFLQGPIQTIKDILDGKKTAQDLTPGEILELGSVLTPAPPAALLPKASGKLFGALPAREGASTAAPTGQAVSQAGQRQGVNLPPAVTSDVPAVQQLGQTVQSIPGGNAPLRQASERAIGELGEAATRVEQGFGRGQPGLAGQKLRAGLETHITERTAQRVADKFDDVAAVIDQTVTAPLTEAAAVAKRIVASRENAKLAPSGAVSQVQAAIDAPGGLNFSGIKDLRTSIGQMLDNPSALPAQIPQAELKSIYAALTKDLEGAAFKAGGEEGRAAFKSASDFTARQSIINRKLNTLLKADSNEQILARTIALASKSKTTTSRADLKKLAQVRRAVDDPTWNELASATIATMGRDIEGNFTPNRFLTAYGALSDGGKKILFSSTDKKGLASALDDIATVSGRFKELQKFANPSGTGQRVGLVAAVLGVTAEPLSTLASLLGANLLSRVLAGSNTARAIADWSKLALQFAENKVAADVMTRATRTLAVQLATEAGDPGKADELAARIQEQMTPPEPAPDASLDVIPDA